jgi:hypothetical protein
LLTVTRGQSLERETYQKIISVETRGKVADDAKLNYGDVKYGETTNIVLDGRASLLTRDVRSRLSKRL